MLASAGTQRAHCLLMPVITASVRVWRGFRINPLPSIVEQVTHRRMCTACDMSSPLLTILIFAFGSPGCK